MKRLIIVLFVGVLALSCTQQIDYKKVRDEVVGIHDQVMADHDKIEASKIKLGALLSDLKGLKAKFPDIDTLKEKVTIDSMLNNLTAAEESMDGWMHKFEPDITGKSNEAAVTYFQAEKVKITAIDSLYKQEIRSSDKYLNKF